MKNISTSDIYLASALSSLGAKLEDVDKTDPRHMQFTFSPKPIGETGALVTIGLDLESVERDWANKVLMVNGVEYADAIKRLKSIVHTK